MIQFFGDIPANRDPTIAIAIPGQIPGTGTNDFASGGNTGEFWSGTLTTTSCKKTISLARTRITLASGTGTQDIFLVAKAQFSAGSCSANGSMTARRVR
jgi:hypothetical protein